MKIARALLVPLASLPALAVPLPSEVGLAASDAVGESHGGNPLPPALDLKSVLVEPGGESAIKLTFETAGSLETPETGSYRGKMRYLFSLDVDNDGFTGNDWGADFSAVLRYDVELKKWDCDFERHSDAYSRRMRITSEVAAPVGNKVSVTIESALFLTAVGGVWNAETRADDEVLDTIAPDRQKPCRIAKGESPAYDDPERQMIFFDNLPDGGSVSHPLQVPDRFASIEARLHVRKFYAESGASPEVVFCFGSKLEEGKPFFGLQPDGDGVVARFGVRGGAKVDQLAVGKEESAFGRDLTLRLERKGSWLAFFVEDELVGSLNARGLITNSRLLTLKVTAADLRADQFTFAVESDEKDDAED